MKKLNLPCFPPPGPKGYFLDDSVEWKEMDYLCPNIEFLEISNNQEGWVDDLFSTSESVRNTEGIPR